MPLSGFSAAALLLSVFAIAPATADELDATWEACRNRGESLSPDLQIAGCTAIIRIKQETSEVLGAAYYYRGNAYADKKDHDRSIADYSEAIRLDPQNDAAYLNRGMEYTDKRGHDRAIADFSEAIRLNPQYDKAYFNRGNSHADKLDLDLAIADYSEAIRLNPQY